MSNKKENIAEFAGLATAIIAVIKMIVNLIKSAKPADKK